MEQVLGNPRLKQLNNKAEVLQRSGASALIHLSLGPITLDLIICVING